jgi:hypothetical protein
MRLIWPDQVLFEHFPIRGGGAIAEHEHTVRAASADVRQSPAATRHSGCPRFRRAQYVPPGRPTRSFPESSGTPVSDTIRATG